MSRTRVLFLAGMGRSGTTLLERVLGEVDGVQPLGEVMHLWQRGIVDDDRCGCGRPFHECPFWTAVGAEAFGGWDTVDTERIESLRRMVDRVRYIPKIARRHPSDADAAAVDEYARWYEQLYVAAAKVSGATVLVDSSKQVSLAYCLARRPDIDLRVVHCVRDSRGVVYSWTKEVVRPERADGTLMPQYSPTTMATQWTAHNAGVAMLPRLDVPVLRMRYEEFVRDPGRSLRRVADFAGVDLPAQPEFLDGDAVTLHESHSAAGNPMRFRTGRIALRVDDAWRAELSPSRRRLVTGLTFPLLARYGYPLGSQPRGSV